MPEKIEFNLLVDGEPYTTLQPIPPGASVRAYAHRGGNKYAVEDDEVNWRWLLDGEELSDAKISSLTGVQSLHTRTQRHTGFKWPDDLRGTLGLEARAHGTNEVLQKWVLPIMSTRDNAISLRRKVRELEARIDQLESQL